MCERKKRGATGSLAKDNGLVVWERGRKLIPAQGVANRSEDGVRVGKVGLGNPPPENSRADCLEGRACGGIGGSSRPYEAHAHVVKANANGTVRRQTELLASFESRDNPAPSNHYR